jgi:hypothetical protein
MRFMHTRNRIVAGGLLVAGLSFASPERLGAQEGIYSFVNVVWFELLEPVPPMATSGEPPTFSIEIMPPFAGKTMLVQASATGFCPGPLVRSIEFPINTLPCVG